MANLRTEAGRNPPGRALSDLVGELSTRSEEFRTRWAAPSRVPPHRTRCASSPAGRRPMTMRPPRSGGMYPPVRRAQTEEQQVPVRSLPTDTASGRYCP
ncbi:MmyB family transcriptional regulator [Arthrobacter sp. UYCu723]